MRPLRGINKTAWGAKLILTADLVYQVSCARLGHPLMAQHCHLCLNVCFGPPAAPHPPPPPTLVSQARPNLRTGRYRLEMISARGKWVGRLSSLIDNALRVNWVWPARLRPPPIDSIRVITAVQKNCLKNQRRSNSLWN